LPDRSRGGLVGIEVLQLAGFARRILEGGAAPRPFESPPVEAEAIRGFLERAGPSLAPFSNLHSFAGGPAALASTLRDVRDAGLDPAELRRAARDLEADAGREVRALAELSEKLAQFHAKLEEGSGLLPASAIARRAAARASDSAFLRSLRAAFYFGLYDLVGVQRDLLAAVGKVVPTTLFFPLVRGRETFAFAERALARIAAQTSIEERSASAAPPLPAEAIEIASAAGIAEEAEVAAKEILRLREEGIPFERIALVSRRLEERLPSLREVFEAHRIPFACAVGPPLGTHPLAKAAAALAHLVGSSFRRRDVLDVVGSPFFSLAEQMDAALTERLSREAGVTDGDSWRRLSIRRSRAAGEESGEGAEDGEERGRVPADIWNAQAPRLLETVQRLREAMGSVPEKGPLRDLAAGFGKLLDEVFSVPANGDGADAWEGLRAILAHLGLLEGEVAGWPLFAVTFLRFVEEARLPGPPLGDRAVRVFEPAGARGRTFDALLLLGMNERVWPRRVPEDPFLPDATRERIEAATGRALPLKREAVDEDRLLFHLLLSGARRRVLLVRSRTDEEGRPANPSHFLDALAPAGGGIREEEVPRPLESRLARSPRWAPRFLVPAEAALATIWAKGEEAARFVREVATACGRPVEFAQRFEMGFRFARALDDLDATLERDGRTGPLAPLWRRLVEEGVSPSGLQDYARCPFRFFAKKALRIEPLENPEDIVSPRAIEIGQIVHDVLRRFYEEVAAKRATLAGVRESLRERLHAAAQAAFDEWERGNPVGYSIAWESWKRRIVETLEAALAEDLEGLEAEGFVPARLEASAETTLPLEGLELPLRGRIDRLDLHPSGRFRVVDYKVSLSAGGSRRNLATEALRGRILQPPLYLLLARSILGAGAEGSSNFLVVRPKADDPLHWETEVSSGFWESELGASFRDSLQTILEGVKEGTFPITPGDQACGSCDFRSICRRDHYASRRRAAASPAAKKIAALAQKEAPG
jgi:ATP-dependent helicase/nuclease subunit B